MCSSSVNSRGRHTTKAESEADQPRAISSSSQEVGFPQLCLLNERKQPYNRGQAYHLLVAEMNVPGWDYPLHLGVTEAGEVEDGRMKSAIGIGTLLQVGLGDTIREWLLLRRSTTTILISNGEPANFPFRSRVTDCKLTTLLVPAKKMQFNKKYTKQLFELVHGVFKTTRDRIRLASFL
ncbi:hypothetical protein SUGI_0963770 [Cryptomeria japonica]|nr:hypothetical protein SUGI_0963770 [Cryptomeria japonica]